MFDDIIHIVAWLPNMWLVVEDNGDDDVYFTIWLDIIMRCFGCHASFFFFLNFYFQHFFFLKNKFKKTSLLNMYIVIWNVIQAGAECISIQDICVWVRVLRCGKRKKIVSLTCKILNFYFGEINIKCTNRVLLPLSCVDLWTWNFVFNEVRRQNTKQLAQYILHTAV